MTAALQKASSRRGARVFWKCCMAELACPTVTRGDVGQLQAGVPADQAQLGELLMQLACRQPGHSPRVSLGRLQHADLATPVLGYAGLGNTGRPS